MTLMVSPFGLAQVGTRASALPADCERSMYIVLFVFPIPNKNARALRPHALPPRLRPHTLPHELQHPTRSCLAPQYINDRTPVQSTAQLHISIYT